MTPAPPPAAHKTVPTTAVSDLEPPEPSYPAASRRLGESGRVMLRVQIGVDGRALDVRVSRSSGYERLGDAALVAVRAARFRPYTEGGTALVVWTTVVFELDG